MFSRKGKGAGILPASKTAAPAARPARPLAAQPLAQQASGTPISARTVAKPGKPGSTGKQAYEARRAEKAGMGVDKWMAEKDRRALAERDSLEQARRKAEPRKPGLIRRLLDRAHKPI